MKSQHFLTRRAFVYSIPDDANEPPANCDYDETLGAWRWGQEREVLVKSTKPNGPDPQTKKMDLETGEDQKGE